jgi:hypothetical protein
MRARRNEGGYVACRDPAVFDRLRLLRNPISRAPWGWFNSGRLDRIVRRKHELLALYREGLGHLPEVRVLGPAAGANQVPFRCVRMADRVRDLMEHLQQAGIQPRWFFHPLPRQPDLREWRAGGYRPNISTMPPIPMPFRLGSQRLLACPSSRPPRRRSLRHWEAFKISVTEASSESLPIRFRSRQVKSRNQGL